MPIIEYSGLKINVDDEGYLVNMDDWNETVAKALAEREGIAELTQDRLDIIKFLRDYYINYNYFPILDSVCLNVQQPHECMKDKFIHPLKAWKIAGLPKPNDIVLTYLDYGMVPT
ncbi:MAG: TusE/DsrC/DsvC family sulfur relay protein [Candidatus Sulfobium sp.]|jgi:TusE/DsrC/DsvC family sulfur relay protein